MNINKLQEKLQNTTDKLGKKIDENIFDTVLYLNAHGFNTVGSCEGHLDHGYAYPWVDIQTEIAVQRESELKKMFRDLQNYLEETDRNYNSAEYKKMKKNYDELNHKLQSESVKIFSKLLEFFGEFYKDRKINIDTQLIITGNDLYFRLQPQGGMLQISRSDEEKKIFLEKYQNEMKDFTDYLKNKLK